MDEGLERLKTVIDQEVDTTNTLKVEGGELHGSTKNTATKNNFNNNIEDKLNGKRNNIKTVVLVQYLEEGEKEENKI